MARRIEVRKARYSVPFVKLANLDSRVVELKASRGIIAGESSELSCLSGGEEIFKGGSAALI